MSMLLKTEYSCGSRTMISFDTIWSRTKAGLEQQGYAGQSLETCKSFLLKAWHDTARKQPAHASPIVIIHRRYCVVTLSDIPSDVGIVNLRLYHEGGKIDGAEVTSNFTDDNMSLHVKNGECSWKLWPKVTTGKYAERVTKSKGFDKDANCRLLFTMYTAQGDPLGSIYWKYPIRVCVKGAGKGLQHARNLKMSWQDLFNQELERSHPLLR